MFLKNIFHKPNNEGSGHRRKDFHGIEQNIQRFCRVKPFNEGAPIILFRFFRIYAHFKSKRQNNAIPHQICYVKNQCPSACFPMQQSKTVANPKCVEDGSCKSVSKVIAMIQEGVYATCFVVFIAQVVVAEKINFVRRGQCAV